MVLLAILFDLHSKDFFFYSCGGIAIKKKGIYWVFRFLDSIWMPVFSMWILYGF